MRVHRAPSTWRRALVTLAGAALALAAPLVPMPFVDRDAFRAGVGDVGRFGLFTLGIVPFLSSAFVVEVVALTFPRLRPLRHGGHAGRSRLTRAAWLLAALFAGAQGWSIARQLASLPSRWGGPLFEELPVIWLGLSLATASLLLAWLATKMSEAGLGDGFAVLLATGALADLATSIQAARRAGLEDALLALWLALHGALAFVAVRFLSARGRTDAPRVPVPTSGLVPPHLASALLVFAAALAPFVPVAQPLAEALRIESTQGVWLAVLTLALTFLLARAFCSPASLTGAWERSGQLPPDGAAAAVRDALAGANRRTIGFVAGIALTPLLASALAVPFLVQSALAVVLVAAVALDLVADARARAADQEPVSAWPLHRVWAVEPTLAALGAAGIAAWPRGRHFRSLFHFFAPYAPIEVMVPADRVAEAGAICARVAGSAEDG